MLALPVPKWRPAVDRGLSGKRRTEFLEWLKDRSAHRQPVPCYPILIPETSPTSYIARKRAVNLHFTGEVTGDWHFDVSFSRYPERLMRAALE